MWFFNYQFRKPRSHLQNIENHVLTTFRYSKSYLKKKFKGNIPKLENSFRHSILFSIQILKALKCLPIFLLCKTAQISHLQIVTIDAESVIDWCANLAIKQKSVFVNIAKISTFTVCVKIFQKEFYFRSFVDFMKSETFLINSDESLRLGAESVKYMPWKEMK